MERNGTSAPKYRRIPLIPITDEQHLSRTRERAAEIEARSAEIGAAIQEQRNVQTEMRLLDTALKATNAASKIHWLRRAADSTGEALAGLSACTQGCSHCCHISVMMSESEAKVIGREIGRKPAKVPDAFNFTGAMRDPHQVKEWERGLQEQFTGVTCTFLRGNECSIYKHRPLACRTHINVDRDSLMCELVEGVGITVPYVDMSPHKAIYIQVFGLTQPYADLRDWFPES